MKLGCTAKMACHEIAAAAALPMPIQPAGSPPGTFVCTVRLPARMIDSLQDKQFVGKGSTAQAAQYHAAGEWIVRVSISCILHRCQDIAIKLPSNKYVSHAGKALAYIIGSSQSLARVNSALANEPNSNQMVRPDVIKFRAL